MVFDGADGDYDELEDDFVLLANDGMPALVPVGPEDEEEEEPSQEEKLDQASTNAIKKNKKGILKKKKNTEEEENERILAEADYRKRDDIVVLNELDLETDEEKRLREYREKVAALVADLPTGNNFTNVFEK